MTEIDRHASWSEFLADWPIERLRSMALTARARCAEGWQAYQAALGRRHRQNRT